MDSLLATTPGFAAAEKTLPRCYPFKVESFLQSSPSHE
jgi:hypothetical protein